MVLFFEVNHTINKQQYMNQTISSPELAYLSPTTRERAIMLAQELIKTNQLTPPEAIRTAILQAKNWAVKSINRSVWKKLKQVDSEGL